MSKYDQRNQNVDTQLNADNINVGLKPVTCPKCKNGNPATSKFCSECGTSLLIKCPICKAETSVGAKYCSGCGNELGLAAEKIKYAESKRGDASRELTYTFSGQVYSPLNPVDHLLAMADKTTMRFTLDVDEYVIRTEEDASLFKGNNFSPDWKGRLHLTNKRLIMFAYNPKNKVSYEVLLYPFSDLRNVKFELTKVLLLSIRILSFLFDGKPRRIQGISNSFDEEWAKVIKENS